MSVIRTGVIASHHLHDLGYEIKSEEVGDDWWGVQAVRVPASTDRPDAGLGLPAAI
jgi:hypothetical protein